MRQACVIQDPINEHQGWLLQRVGEEPDPYLFREWRWHLDLQRKKWACGRMPDQYDELVAQVLRPGHAVLAPSPLRKSWGAEE